MQTSYQPDIGELRHFGFGMQIDFHEAELSVQELAEACEDDLGINKSLVARHSTTFQCLTYSVRSGTGIRRNPQE